LKTPFSAAEGGKREGVERGVKEGRARARREK